MKQTHMKKMQISFPKCQLAAIKEESDQRGLSMAELIRRILDAYLDQKEKDAKSL